MSADSINAVPVIIFIVIISLLIVCPRYKARTGDIKGMKPTVVADK